MSWLNARPAGIRPRAVYEAADYKNPHRSWRDGRDADATIGIAGERLRRFARHLEQNHDLSKGALDRLQQFIVGPYGIGVEPLPRTVAGQVHTEMAATINSLWQDWQQWPDVTWEANWATLQRIACRSWLRDGEVFGQIITGYLPTLDHGTLVPLSIELLEAERVPLDYTDLSQGIHQGIERNVWGRPRAYHVYRYHPGSGIYHDRSKKRIPADYMLHVKLADRIGQSRGVSIFSSVLSRLNNIAEYETSEQIAARMAADMAGQVKKGAPDVYDPPTDLTPRQFSLERGMLFDDLRPGETIELFDHKRPNPNLEQFRAGQLRAASAGIGLSASSISRNYDGTYSAQRQELVENHPHYAVLSAQFIFSFVAPIYRWFIDAALSSNLLNIPGDLDRRTLYGAVYNTPPMPWIDPQKEAAANQILIEQKLRSPQQIIRDRGSNPEDVLNQFQEWNRLLAERNLTNEIGNSLTEIMNDEQLV